MRHEKNTAGRKNPVRSGCGKRPYPSGMDDRFEFRLSAERRNELARLAGETGLSASDLVRLSINKLVQDRDALPRLPMSDQTGEANAVDRILFG
jgi:hypothetical protein